jgi:HK97 family phage major capsid protein
MKTISQYKKDVAALIEQLGEMRAQCVQDGRNPTEEERATARALLNEIAEIEDIMAVEIELQDTMKRSKETEERQVPPEGADGKKGPVNKEERFASFGEQMQAVMKAGMGRGVDPRLRIEQRSPTGLSESVPSDGGFLVQSDFAADMIQGVFDTGIIAPRCRRIPISARSNRLVMNALDETARTTGNRWGGIRAYWADEATEKTASKPKMREMEWRLRKLVGLCYATDELLDDAAALESVIRDGFREEFSFMLDDAIINGNGAGQPLGVMNSGCLVTQAKETGQAASTIVFNNITKMYSRLIARSRPSAVWLINQDVEPQLYTLALEGTTSGLVAAYLPPGGLSGQQYGTLFGRPVIPVEHCQTVGTAGDIILGDFSNYILVDKGGMESAMSIHVRFVYDESVFRFVMRVDGQPFLRKAITPYKGSNTISHFVRLITRS